MTTPITAHASSPNLTHHDSAMTNRRSTRANDEDNGGIPETSLHRRNDHQGIRCQVEEVTTHNKTLSSRTDTHQEEAKASHLANFSRRRVCFKEIASYVARQAIMPLIVLNVFAFRPCLCSCNNLLRITTLSRETECCATQHWL